jgi:tetratricopeptide (TPR) repeat protein
LRQAIDTFGAALEVTPDPAQRARLLERMGILQTYRSDWEEGYANLRAAVDGFAALGDRIGVLRATGELVQEHLNATRIAEAEKLAASIRDGMEALVTTALERGTGTDRGAGEAAAVLADTMARLEFRRRQFGESIRWADRAATLAEPLRLDETVAHALVTKGTAMASSGRLREGIALLEGAVVDATAHRQNLAALRGLNNLSAMTAEIDPRASLERTKLGMATARRLGLRTFNGYHAGNGIAAAECLGEWSWIREAVGAMLEDGERESTDLEWLAAVRDFFSVWTGEPDVARGEHLLAVARLDNDYQSERNLLGFLARCAFAAGDVARALDIVGPIIERAERSDGFEFPMAARFALHAGQLDVARRMLEVAGAGSGGASDHDLEMIRGGVAGLEGRRDDAAELYRAALAGYRSYGMRFSFAITVFDMAKLLGPDDPAVRSVLEEGRSILEELGARTLLAQLDALESEASRTTTAEAAREVRSAVS